MKELDPATEAWIARLLDEAPPPTPEQIDLIRRVFNQPADTAASQVQDQTQPAPRSLDNE